MKSFPFPNESVGLFAGTMVALMLSSQDRKASGWIEENQAATPKALLRAEIAVLFFLFFLSCFMIYTLSLAQSGLFSSFLCIQSIIFIFLHTISGEEQNPLSNAFHGMGSPPTAYDSIIFNMGDKSYG